MSERSLYFDFIPGSMKPQTSIPIGVLEWRELEEFPEYEISTFGLIRRHKPGPNKKYHLVGNIIKPYLVDGIYPEVELTNSSGQFKRKVHHLIAETFLEREPKSGEIIRHLDHRPQTPTAWSIGWGSVEDNSNDRNYHRLVHALQNPSEEVVKCAALLIDMGVNGLNGKEASKKWDVSYSKISKLKSGRRHGLELKFLREVISRFAR